MSRNHVPASIIRYPENTNFFAQLCYYKFLHPYLRDFLFKLYHCKLNFKRYTLNINDFLNFGEKCILCQNARGRRLGMSNIHVESNLHLPYLSGERNIARYIERNGKLDKNLKKLLKHSAKANAVPMVLQRFADTSQQKTHNYLQLVKVYY